MPTRKPDPLATYRRKRSPGRTPEPFHGGARAGDGVGLFVVHKHHARHLHWDLRLEMDGVLRSWAVPKGPSANPAEKRFAALVEDHPLDYADFEGEIPAGNYGAGSVIVWDRGAWRPVNDPAEGMVRGKLLFDLAGYKLRGRWTLVKMKGARHGDSEWLFIKERDAWADDELRYPEDSVLSGLTVDELPERDARAARLARSLARRAGVTRARATIAPAPMLAVTGEPFDRDGWVFELKYDGYRLGAVKDRAGVRLVSRNGHDLTAVFPEIAASIAALPYPQLVIDGEVVVHDDRGAPSFSRLQERVALPGAAEVARAAIARPATLYAFDLLQLLDYDLRRAPLTDRKRYLKELLPSSGAIRYSEHVARHGRKVFATARSLGLEGIVGKRADAPYRAGRSGDWVKARMWKSDDFVIAGWIPARGNARDLGALALAEHRGGALTYAGRVGSGLDAATRRQLLAKFADAAPGEPLTDDREVRWLTPSLVCEVAYREYTRDGHLRQPVFERLRPDKDPAECTGRFDDPAPVRLAPEPAHEVVVTNADKVFFPEANVTKGDLVTYYESIAPWMLPYLVDRPLVLTRFPDGIHGKSFYQRDAPAFVPDWVRREVLWSEGAEREVHYFIANDAATLVYLANLGTIPIHAWHSRIGDLAHPDWCVLDLDPKGAPFADVVSVARAIADLAEEIAVPSFVKTSGASGLHVLLPLARQLTHDHARTLGELLARVIVGRLPEIATIARSVRSRQGKVYVDYLQNGHGRLLVAPFSVRAEPAASVSMPLRWHEVNRRLSNERHHVRNAPRRLARLGEDPLAGVLTAEPDLPRALAALADLMRGSADRVDGKT